ncbi:MAG: elongation factor EF-2 [Candidatus Bathyarchaeia archaeon]
MNHINFLQKFHKTFKIIENLVSQLPNLIIELPSGDLPLPKFRQTAEIAKIMHKKEAIRNIGITAHIDHGKTTVTDSLLADAGLLSPRIAGKARALDYLVEEQKRGITIKTANISLLHEVNGYQYIINLIDTPGHVDFTGKVARALRAIDGALVVVDAVEEVMAQTETVTRQALEERVKPVLFINKVDRLINDLRFTPGEIQDKLIRIIRDFNTLIEIYGEPEFKKKWKVNPQEETVAFGSALHRWGFTLKTAQEKGIKFADIKNAYEESQHKKLAKLIPLHKAILDMVVKNIPNPVEAQGYRVPKIWRGDINSGIGRAMLNCEDDGPTVMCITMVQMNPEVGLVATGRLFSGLLKNGDQVYLLGSRKTHTAQQVSIYMGAFREVIDKIKAGNIAAVLGLDTARAGETLVEMAYKNIMAPFERMKCVSEPILTITVEPENPRDLPRLIDAMNRLSIEDPDLSAVINRETGECLLTGLGELHLEIAVKSLQDYTGGLEIITSKPMAVYRESVSGKGIIAKAESSNRRNTFWIQVEPLEENVINLMEKGKIAEDADLEHIETLPEKAGWPSREAGNILAIEEHKNMLVNMSKSIQHLQDVKEIVASSFKWACKAGPLCGEPFRGVKVKLVDAQLHEDPVQRGPAQIMPTVHRALLASFLTAKPVILEPVYKISISIPSQLVGVCMTTLTGKRGRILAAEQKDTLTTVTGYIPVAETFSLSSEMRSATSGHAFWQCTFDHWEKLGENIAHEVIKQIREKKGIHLIKPTVETFTDEA